jgi:hypothetical protein
MKKVEQKVYSLGKKSGKENNTDDVLFLCINGVKSDLLFSELFDGYEQSKSSIVGYSALGSLHIEDYRVMLEDIAISIWNETSNEEVYITNMRPPYFVQMADKDVDEDVIISIVKAKYIEMFEKEKQEVEIINEIETEQKETQEEKEYSESYENAKEDLIKKGFVDFYEKENDYCLFFKESEMKGILLKVYPEHDKFQRIKYTSKRDNENKTIVITIENQGIELLFDYSKLSLINN